MHTTKMISAFHRVPVHTTTESFLSALISILKRPQLPLKQYRTQVVPNRPGLIIVKMDVSLPVCLGEERMCQDPSRPVERQIISMPVPGGKTNCTSDKRPCAYSEQHHMAKGGEPLQGDSSCHSHPKSIPPVRSNCFKPFGLPQTQFCICTEEAELGDSKPWGSCMFSQGCFSPPPFSFQPKADHGA